jgi:hypothetical protein
MAEINQPAAEPGTAPTNADEMRDENDTAPASVGRGRTGGRQPKPEGDTIAELGAELGDKLGGPA